MINLFLCIAEFLTLQSITLCKKAGVPIISVHCLRHTHASLLIFAGVSIASIAKRLGHSSVSTTQETYLHIIKELESQDNDKIMNHLSLLT
jgi:integrase